MIAQIDIVVRLVACGAALLLLVLLMAGNVRRGLKVAVAGLLVGACAYLINASPMVPRTAPVEPFVDLASLFTPFFTWLFALRLFEKEPDRRVLIAVTAILVASWFIGHFVPGSGLIGFYTIHIASLGLVADLLRKAFTGRADDLVEKRRVIRLWLPILVAMQAGGILTVELVTGLGSGSGGHHPLVELTNALLILALTLFAGLALLQTDPELLVQTEGTTGATQIQTDLSPSEIVLRDKLDAAMNGGFYRTPGLTITSLAEFLETPEHRLRALINRRLGHRNFSTFLNRYRIDEAKEALADREKVDLPVLTIAMDLGYNSLPTFNRAFRTETGQTPTDFRKQVIGQN